MDFLHKPKKWIEYRWFRIYSTPTNRNWVIPWYFPTGVSVLAVIVAIISPFFPFFPLSTIEISLIAVFFDMSYIAERSVISAEKRYIQTKDLIMQIVGSVEDFAQLIQDTENGLTPNCKRTKRQITIAEELTRSIMIGEISGYKPRATPYNDSAEAKYGIFLKSIRSVKQHINRIETSEEGSEEQKEAIKEAQKQRDIFASVSMEFIEELINSIPGMWAEEMKSLIRLKQLLDRT